MTTDYEFRKKDAIKKVADTLEEVLKDFGDNEQDRIREDLGNYVFGYLGLSFGLHVKRGE